MKKLIAILFFISCVCTTSLYAQKFVVIKNPASYKNLHVGFGTGVNAYTGYLGSVAEYRLSDRISTFGALGVGSWGVKTGIGLKYLTIDNPVLSAVSLGYSHAFGRKNFEMSVNVYGRSLPVDVDVDFLRSGAINMVFEHFFMLKNNNRLVVFVGYGFKTTSNPWVINGENVRIRKEEKSSLDMRQPGGFIFGATYMFSHKSMKALRNKYL